MPSRKKSLMLLIVALSFALSFTLYPFLPETIAVHWNIKGEADRYMPKHYAAFFTPLLAFTILFLFLVIPGIDPLKRNIEKFLNYYENFIILLLSFLFYIHLIILMKNMGHEFSIIQAISPGLGVLLFYSGMLLEKAKRNWFIGIRTPWTLSSEKVWRSTHKLGAKLFKASGIIAFLGFFVEKYALVFILVPVLVSSLICVIYSYLEFEKLNKKR